MTFILLVAVGADYNMLLISRIRDESPHGVRVGVIRTVGSTGGVITSAGLIFAASMFGLLPASVSTMSEAGFIIGIGIVLDTFLVRTITVPALAALIGQANWWPSRLGQSPNRPLSARKPTRKGRLPAPIVRLKDVFGRKAGFAVPPPPTPSQAPLHPLHPLTRGTEPTSFSPTTPSRCLASAPVLIAYLVASPRPGNKRRFPQRPTATGRSMICPSTRYRCWRQGPEFPDDHRRQRPRHAINRQLTTHALPLFSLDCLPTPSNGKRSRRSEGTDPIRQGSARRLSG